MVLFDHIRNRINDTLGEIDYVFYKIREFIGSPYIELTIGEILEKLSDFDECENIIISDGNASNIVLTGRYGSYKGNYKVLDLSYDYLYKDKKYYNTVKEIRTILHSALTQGIMYGHHGGEFAINENTLILISFKGTISDIRKVNGKIIMILNEY